MRHELTPTRLSELIGLIYDCVIEPARWQAAVDAVRIELGFATAEIAVMRLPDGEPLMSATSGIAPEWLSRFQRERTAGAVDLWGGPERLRSYPLAEPIVLSQAVGRAHMEAHPFHQNFAAEMGLADLVSMALMRDKGALAEVGLGWPAARGELAEQHIAPLRLLAPHLRRAVTIQRLLDLERRAANTFAQALELLPTAVLLLDVRLAIVHANSAAEAMLSARDVMYADPQRGLRIRAPMAHASLADALARAASGGAALGQRGIGIPLVRRAGGPPLVAHVLPLHAGECPSGVSPRAAAALFVADAAAPAAVPVQALALLYDLTPAEVRVFELIASGHASAQIAAQLGLAPSTVKTHLLRVFDKTGCRRQAELVHLAAALTA